MALPRALHCSSRTIRRSLLVASAVVVLLLAACSSAWAGEEPKTATAAQPLAHMDTTALARAQIAENRFGDALSSLAHVIASDRPEAERAAAIEMRSMALGWVARGLVMGPRDATDLDTSTDLGVDPGELASPDGWERGFGAARARMVAGRFPEAARDFSALFGAAKTTRTALCAYVLATLASELVAKGLALRAATVQLVRDPRSAEGKATARGQRRHWYGWQTIVADGVTFVVIPVIGSQIAKGGGESAIAGAVAGSYLLLPPIIHLVHGRPGIAAASLASRIGLPLTGGLLGAAASSNCRGDLCGLGGAAVGAVAGGVAATALDATVLSFETRDDDSSSRDEARAARPPPKPYRVEVMPVVGPRKEGGVDVGVGAVF